MKTLKNEQKFTQCEIHDRHIITSLEIGLIYHNLQYSLFILANLPRNKFKCSKQNFKRLQNNILYKELTKKLMLLNTLTRNF